MRRLQGYACRALFVVALSLSAALVGAERALQHFVGVHPSFEILYVYGSHLRIGEQDASPGDEVAVFTGDGVLCGATQVTTAGCYPGIAVYKDDAMTSIKDGARAGEPLYFRVWDASTSREYGGTTQIALAFVEKPNAQGQPYWTSSNDLYRVDVSAAEGMTTISLALSPGWNLLSLPFDTPADQALTELLVDAAGTCVFAGSAWRWDAQERHYAAVRGALGGGEGIWFYSPLAAPVTTRPLLGILSSPAVLRPGWNLTGPITDTPIADLEAQAGPSASVWLWDATRQRYRPPAPGTVVTRGMGYWSHSGGD
jgi:hypothetical protein